jgi:hypothetical protein
MTMTFINRDSAEMLKCADEVLASTRHIKYCRAAVTRACSFYSGDSALAIQSLPAVNSSSCHLDNSASEGVVSIQTFRYLMIACAVSTIWTVLWAGAATTCITCEFLFCFRCPCVQIPI